MNMSLKDATTSRAKNTHDFMKLKALPDKGCNVLWSF